MAHVYLTAHFQNIRGTVQGLRYIFYCQGVGGDIFTNRAIAAGGGLHQLPLFIAQRQAQPVYLGFGGEGQFFRNAHPQEPTNAGIKLGHLRIVKGVAQ